MIKIRIHIENEVDIFDELVYIDCKLPNVPAIGSILHLTRDLQIKLQEIAKNAETKEDYLNAYTYGSGFSFDDCVEVKAVKYVANNETVSITLGSF